MADDNANMIAALQGLDPANALADPNAPMSMPMKFAHGAANALGNAASNIWNLPQRAIEGSAHDVANLGDHTQPLQSVPPAVEATRMLVGAGAPMAESGAAGIFGGRLAQTADLRALDEAQKMRMGGVHPDQVWHDTGWGRYPTDEQWRFEIPDNKAALSYMPPADADRVTGNLSSLMSHQDFYKAYPQAQNWGLDLTKDLSQPNGAGMWHSAPKIAEVSAPNSSIARSTALHELQHGVQDVEGFAKGTNPDYYAYMIAQGLKKNPALAEGQDLRTLLNQAMPLYKRTAGEVEARNTQLRADLSPSQRRAVPPWLTQDTDFGNQVVFDPVANTLKALRRP
jgi:hypothetical protein